MHWNHRGDDQDQRLKAALIRVAFGPLEAGSLQN